MRNSNDSKSRSRILALSALAGLGYAIVGFIFGTGFTLLLIFLYFKIIGGAFSGVGFLISMISGLMTALAVGMVGGKLTSQRLSRGSNMTSKVSK